jgi:hypothetical protein
MPPDNLRVDTLCVENFNQTPSFFTSTPMNTKSIAKKKFEPSLSVETTNITEEVNNSFENLEGRRIVNIRHIFESIQSIKHIGFECTFRDLEFVKEIRTGFFSKFCFICKICHIQENIYSENPSGSTMNINMAVVSAVVNTGQGYTQLEEYAATLNMPIMSNRKYQELHKNVFYFTHKMALEGMVEAGKEEGRLAIERGDVDQHGRPKIAVIADGAWSKRSYKTNYNALSGVVSISFCYICRK